MVGKQSCPVVATPRSTKALTWAFTPRSTPCPGTASSLKTLRIRSPFAARCAPIALPFFFEKTLTLNSGSPVLEIDEVLVNEGEEPVHCIWGQHIALGPPFLSEDCLIDLPGGRLFNHPDEWDPNNRLKAGFEGAWPWSDAKDGERIDLSRVPPRSVRANDMSYITDMPEGWYAITNQRMNLGFGVVFPKELFRYLWYWQSLGGGFGYPWYGRTYNIGLEPFTSYSNQGLEAAVNNGIALLVQPGQQVEASVKAVVFTQAQGVERIHSDGTVVLK